MKFTKEQLKEALKEDHEVALSRALDGFVRTLTPEQIKQLQTEADLKEFDEVFLMDTIKNK